MYITTLIVSVTFYFAFRIINVIFKIMTETFQQKTQQRICEPDQQTQQNIQEDSSSPAEQPIPEEQELISDFSSMFKKKEGFARKPTRNKTTQNKTPNWLLQIPAKLEVTLEDLQRKSVMDNRKWMSIAKANEPDLKIVAAVCSCYNYLFSDKGLGNAKLLTVKKCLELIDDDVKVQNIREAKQFDRLGLVHKIIEAINKKSEFKMQGVTSIKLADPQKVEKQAKQQKQQLLEGIIGNKSAYIYLGYEDIFCPIGFDKTPLKHLQAYQKIENILPAKQQLWIISSTLGRNEPSFCIKRWTDIQKDLQTTWPNYFDIKQVKQGVQLRPDATEENKNEIRGTSNCIIQISPK